MSTFLVTVQSGDFIWYLRGTTWTSFRDRANTFPTRLEAEEAWGKAKKFTHWTLRPKVRIAEEKI